MKGFFLWLLGVSLLSSLLNVQQVSAADGNYNLLPLPQQVVKTKGVFKLNKLRLQTPVMGEEWKVFVAEHGGSVVESAPKTISVKLVGQLPSVKLNSNEAYALKVTPKEVSIRAETETGVLRAMQTLHQLVEGNGKKSGIPCCEILDWPAFRVRGWMQDVGRSYISVEELKREISALAQFKVNVFHMHFTENQAWRLESRIFPMLNDSVNMTRMPGKYYTFEEVKDLIAHCRKNGMLFIPELDMPGHSAAFVRAFRHDMQSPEGMRILKLLVDEACSEMDVPYLHIGTDEVQFTNPDFVPEMVKYVRSKGKKVISWNPGWNYKPGEIDMTQLWSYRGKAQKGIPAIDSKFHYINHFDNFADIVALYYSRIYDQAEGSDDIAGAVVGIWNDRLLKDERDIPLENGLYPAMLTLAERAWRGGGTEYFNRRGTLLPEKGTEEFDEFVEFEERMLWHKVHTLKGLPFAYVKQTNVEWNITDAFPNGGDLGKVFPPEKELKAEYEYDGRTYKVGKAAGAGIYLRHVWGPMVPGFYKEPKENHTAYAYTWVHSPKQQEVGLFVEFQNYSRSEMDLPPKLGTWDYKGSRIWINDNEIMPPVWTATHTVKSNEIALGNENAAARKPVLVKLNKGWNKVFMKLPVGGFRTDEVRLVKWMFTAVFVTPDGKKEVEGLEYSRDAGASL